MIPTEEFYAEFEAAGMLKIAAWIPSGGGPRQEHAVRFRTGESDALSGEQKSTDYTMRFPASVFPGIRRGETVSIDGVAYRLREDPDKRMDGSELEVRLARVG